MPQTTQELLESLTTGHEMTPGELDDLLTEQVPEDLYLDYKHGDVLNNRSEVFAVNRDGKYVSVVNGNGKTIWKSEDDYGGNGTYFEYIPSYNTGDREKSDTFNFFLPLPLQVTDLNRDGLNEVITIFNEPLLWGVMSRVRSYKKGMIASLIWDGSGLYQQAHPVPRS